MAFELQFGEAVGAGVRRIVDEQLASALEDLRTGDPRKADAAVHAARKRFKRIRAIVRLVREELGDEVFERENASFRDAGGTLSEARDAAVLVLTLDTLKPAVDAAAFAAARKLLLARRRAVKKRVLETGNGLESVAVLVEEARQRIVGWTIPGDGWEALEPGLLRVYRDGRRALEEAEVGGPAELFHQCRKRTKDLWHQLEVLHGVWPQMMKDLADAFHTMANHLGQEHDLAVLKAVLEAQALARAVEASAVVAAAEVKRADLQRQAKALGGRLFAEKPRAFVRRMGKYWLEWKREAAAQVKEEPAVALTAAAAGEASEVSGAATAAATTPAPPVPEPPAAAEA